MHASSNCKPTPIPLLDVYQTQFIGNIKHELLAHWAMNSTYHTILQVTSAQLAFHCDIVMLTSCMAHWQSICQQCQAITDCDNLCQNVCRVPHTYSVGDLVLIHQDTHGKLAKSTHRPYQLIDVACQHVNGTIMVDLNHSHETFNIQQLIHLNLAKSIEDTICHTICLITLFPFGNYDSHIWVITVHADPLRKSIHFLHQYTLPFTTLPSVIFYKEGLYISMQHSSKH
jgi:hypothetical protein